MNIRVRLAAIAMAVCFLPSAAWAQGALTGAVRDTSGAVLPGVTVEASSPALIEKVRTAVTDGAGQYRIEDLRPGTYVVTFSLPGFRTVRREGIELTGSFTATVTAQLSVGALEETITVTGESPVVDVVNAKQQSILDNEVISAIPTARLYHSLATLVPGVTISGNQDVGGTRGPLTVTFSMRGGPGNEGRLTVDGLSLGASLNGTGVSYTVADVGNAQEVVFSTGGSLGEAENAGPAMNLVPRVGGNRFDEAIANYIRRKYNLMIGDRTAEQVKIEIGSALPLEEPLRMEVKGRDMIAGLPRTIPITSTEITEAIEQPLQAIITAVRNVLEQTPPELSSDIIDKGMVMTGGGALLRNLDQMLTQVTGIPCHVAENALNSVAVGTGMALEHFGTFRKSLVAH